jgi:hypothetical protein
MCGDFWIFGILCEFSWFLDTKNTLHFLVFLPFFVPGFRQAWSSAVTPRRHHDVEGVPLFPTPPTSPRMVAGPARYAATKIPSRRELRVTCRSNPGSRLDWSKREAQARVWTIQTRGSGLRLDDPNARLKLAFGDPKLKPGPKWLVFFSLFHVSCFAFCVCCFAL